MTFRSRKSDKTEQKRYCVFDAKVETKSTNQRKKKALCTCLTLSPKLQRKKSDSDKFIL